MKVERITYDKTYPIRIADGWGGKVCLTEEQAQEIIKKLQEILKNPLTNH